MIIQHGATGYIVTSLGYDGELDMWLEFDTDEPLVIALVLDPDRVWHFGRNLLSDALRTPGPHGRNDVTTQLDGTEFRIFLDSPEGAASIRLDAVGVFDFVTQVYHLMPEDKASKVTQDQLEEFLDEFMIDDEEY